MTNTKWLSALLAGTALTVASTAAMADTSLVTMTRNAAGEGVTFSIAPTADMPASATEITVGGRVRAEVYSESGDETDMDEFLYNEGTGIRADWALYISGKTDTSVGQVRAFVNMYGNGAGNTTYGSDVSANVTSVSSAGEWDFAPGLTLIGGNTTTLDGGTMGFGADIGTWLGRYGTIATGDHANEVVGVRYSSGPMSVTAGVANDKDDDNGENFDVTGQVMFDMGVGTVGASFIRGEEVSGTDTGYSASIGATIAAGDQLSFSGVFTMSDGRTDYYTITDTGTNYDEDDCDNVDEECSAISLGATYATGDFKFSAGYAIQSDDDEDTASEIRGSVAWSATPKLSIVGQIVNKSDEDDGDTNVAGVGAWFKF